MQTSAAVESANVFTDIVKDTVRQYSDLSRRAQRLLKVPGLMPPERSFLQKFLGATENVGAILGEVISSPDLSSVPENIRTYANMAIAKVDTYGERVVLLEHELGAD